MTIINVNAIIIKITQIPKKQNLFHNSILINLKYQHAMRDVDGNYSDKGFEEKASAAQITYSRKPLSFVLPALRESQAAKNPFRKFYLRLKTTTNIKVTGSSLQGTSDPPPVKKFHSLTPTQQKRTKVTLEKVPKPSLFVSEPVEGDSSPLEDYENSEKEELKKGEKDKELQEPDYEITLTREVMYHFRELEKVGFVSLEEVRKKSITLPDVKGKKKSNKTLLLDLDDTLVHTVDPNLNYSSIKIDTANVKCTMYLDPYLSSMVNLKVVIRPNAMKFLQEISPFYEIVVGFFLFLSQSRYSLQDRRPTQKHCWACWTLKEN
eukprot:TRINITY_DN135024_c1_g1_i1.p3 TRINITY_DN135024_c1_g1~~TRINITY_DN135024_c1_g1_i1.p3  ORF type:complete len:321 (-),score=30.80 TRINITY_DN135024_c1_g1_i1:2943-3905(-)